MNFDFHRLYGYDEQVSKLPDAVSRQLEKCLRFLAVNPRHRSLQTHVVKSARGKYGGPVFEAYVNKQYRLTFEYGPEHSIVLRNVDNHDECLKHP